MCLNESVKRGILHKNLIQKYLDPGEAVVVVDDDDGQWTSVAVYLTVASHSTLSTQHRARCHVNPACIVSRTSK